MAANQNDLDNENTSINITPLVDIMLVLLIIFMVTANLQQKKTIDVKLPEAQTGQEVAVKGENFAISIDKNSEFYLNGVKSSLSEIESKVSVAKASSIPLQISIAADESTPHGVVMKAIDAMRRLEIFDFSLDVESK